MSLIKAEFSRNNISIKKYMLCVVCIIMSIIILSTSSFISAVSVNNYVIKDGRTTLHVYSMSTDEGEILGNAGITLNEDDTVSRQGNTFTIIRVFTVFFNMDEKSTQIRTSACTVEEALKKAGVVLSGELGCSKPLDEMLYDTTFLDVAEVVYKEEFENKTIPYTYETQKTDTLYQGTTVVAKEGSTGSKKLTYNVKYINGKEVERTVTKTEILKEAKNGLKLIGTKSKAALRPKAKQIESIITSHVDGPKKGVKTSLDMSCISVLKAATPIQLDANGIPVNAKYSKTVQATAYHESHGGTATGVRQRPGIVAVNPNIIPYGTKMYIVSTDGKYHYGYAIAADTGGFIKSRPTNVDLNFASEAACRAFGRRNVTIYFL